MISVKIDVRYICAPFCQYVWAWIAATIALVTVMMMTMSVAMFRGAPLCCAREQVESSDLDMSTGFEVCLTNALVWDLDANQIDAQQIPQCVNLGMLPSSSRMPKAEGATCIRLS